MARQEIEQWRNLALRLRAGDADSESELARLFYPHLMGMAASRLSNRETAREIVQDALLAVISALLAAAKKNLSLVDCVSFELMGNLGIRTAFAFDAHFKDAGFGLCS